MKEKIIIKSSTFKKFKTLLPTILVFCVGIQGILNPYSHPRYNWDESDKRFSLLYLIIGILIFIFAGLYLIYKYKTTMKNKNVLEIDGKGFTDYSLAVPAGRILWQDVESIYLSQKPNDKRIFVELNNSDQFFQNMLSNKNKFLGLNIMSSVNSVEINCAVAKDDTEYIYDKMKISYESWKHNPNFIIE